MFPTSTLFDLEGQLNGKKRDEIVESNLIQGVSNKMYFISILNFKKN